MGDVIPESEWVWCGYPGHFIGSNSCRFHLHTRVGDWRISTVGDYWPWPLPGRNQKRETIGVDRYYETAVVEVSGHGLHGEGLVIGDYWIEGYQGEDALLAEKGHFELCRKVAAGWTPNEEGDANG